MANLRKQNGREKPWNVKFFAVGNENWGCGGNMFPDVYANNYRRYQTFCRNYGDNRLQKVAGGANVDDYNWTETLMRMIPAHMMWGISLHYYVHPGGWEHKGSATHFSNKEYVVSMQKAIRMEDLIARHSTIIDKYDPQKRVALVVDEWGAWYNSEPGTNPGFLYQQNTMRDALIAATTLNIFHRHCDRVKMANLAQIVNVLQALILTEGEKMILTPTYHIFDMYKVHQDALMLPTQVKCGSFAADGQEVEQLNVSSSIDNNGVMHISFVNLDLENDVEVTCSLRGANAKSIVDAQMLTTKHINAYNSFDNPHAIELQQFGSAKLKNNVVTLTLPAKSVVTIACR